MNPDPENFETNSTDTPDDFDTEGALAELSSGLFGQGDDSEANAGADTSGVESPEVPVVGAVEPLAAQEPVADDNAPAVQSLGAPATWTKEAIAEWAQTPPRIQQEILKREEDMYRGLEQYREKADLGQKYDAVVEPYRAALAAEGVEPTQLFQAFAGNHWLLTRGTPDQKLELAANMMQHYGIDMTALAMRIGDGPAPISPELKALQDQVGTLSTKLTAREQADNEARFTELRATVEAFASDPANPYFNEVSSDMKALLDGKVASTLQQAYDMAVYNNPTTRQKELDRLIAEKISAQTAVAADKVNRARSATAADVKTSPKTRDGTVPVGTMDDTLNETYARISANG